jgi:tetratricopeptide (TPR) repeat protein
VTTATPITARRRNLLPVTTIFAVTLAAYLPILHAGFIWDDDKHVTLNTLLRSTQGLQTLWLDRTALPQYYPLTHTFFWIEYHLWGDRPFGYHAVNLLLHIGNAIFVWMILRRLSVRGALLAAILFAVHPVNVETVGWIAERKNTLSGFFYLLSLLAYLRLQDESRRRANWYLLSLTLFICSLLCKSVTCTLPAAMLLITWWRDGRLRLRDLTALVPFFTIGALLGLNTAYLERTRVTASGAEWRFASTIPGEIIARCLIAGRAVWFYLSKLFLPHPLMFEYPRWHINVSILWQYAFPAAAAFVVISVFLLRQRLGRGPLACFLYFVGTLFPALGFANLYPMRFSFVADHFQYLASIGPLTFIAACLCKRPLARAHDFLPIGILVSALLLLTFARTFAFQDQLTLYADSISKNPKGWLSQTNYGVLLAGNGDLDGAVAHLSAGVALHPDNAPAADKLGQIAEFRNQDAAAAIWFRRAIAMDSTLGVAHYDLANLLKKDGDVAGALGEYQLAIEHSPNHAPAHLSYGVLLANQSNYTAAAKEFAEAVRIDSASTHARKLLIAALEQSGQFAAAITQIHQLLQKTPSDALLYNDLGLAETALHADAPAIAAFSHALALDPTLSEARQHLDALITHAASQP